MLATCSLQPAHVTEKAPDHSLANISLITVYRQLKSILADKKNYIRSSDLETPRFARDESSLARDDRYFACR